jgi:hypothetical protein
LTILLLAAAVANAGNLSVYDKNSKAVAANLKIEVVHQSAIGGMIQMDIIPVAGGITCAINLRSQTEFNSILAALNTGSDITCSDARLASDKSGYIASSYSLGSFYGEK